MLKQGLDVLEQDMDALKDNLKALKCYTKSLFHFLLHKNKKMLDPKNVELKMCSNPIVGAKNVCQNVYTLVWVIISKISQEWGLKWWLIALYSWSARVFNGGPQFRSSLCPCKYTIKWEIQRGKAKVLVSMIIKYAYKWRCKLI